MKTKSKRILIAFSVIFIVSSGILTAVILKTFNGDNGNGEFDPVDRYDSTLMDYMGVVYDNQADIYTFTAGYSENSSCPWGYAHPGIDYALNNNSNVISAIPGQVIDVMVQDYGESAENRFMIHVVIRYNISLTVDYAFEPWTNKSTDKDHQLELLDIEEGDWVQKGDKIATFLKAGISAHIHFMVHENNIIQCPCEYLGTSDHAELMNMILSFQPEWDLCYH